MDADVWRVSTGPGLDTAAQPLAPVSRAFMAGYVVAQVGAYVSFLPLLLILAPMKAAVLAPGHKAQLLSLISALGALTAAASNLAAGWASDRTRGSWGRRRPWIFGGAIATALSYGLIARAHTPLALTASILVFQLVFNFAFAPLAALIPDRVPDRQKGWVSALTGLGLPLGSVIGSAVVAALATNEAGCFAALGLIVAGTMAPFALAIRDPLPPGPAPAGMRGPAGSAGRALWGDFAFSADFAYVWIGRCLVQTAFSLAQVYLLYFLEQALVYGVDRAGRPETDMARLSAIFAIANVGCGLLAGRLSDRLRRRKPFVIVGALVVGAAALGLASAHAWPVIAASYAILGCGAGCYFAADLALVAQVLPSLTTAGRDLGVVNLSSTLPQVAGPALAGLLLSLAGPDLRWVYGAAALLAVTGAAMAAPIRHVR
jgi:MFS family permease